MKYSDFMEVVRERHSTRTYDPAPLSQQEINDVLEAARLAPSACNKQPWRFYAVTNKAVREKMLAKSRPGFLDASVAIVAVGLHSQAWHRPSDGKDHTDVDVSIAVEHICLAAQARGLDTCWVCSFDVQAVRDALSLADDEEPIAIVPMGRAAHAEAPAKNRKAFDDVVVYVE